MSRRYDADDILEEVLSRRPAKQSSYSPYEEDAYPPARRPSTDRSNSADYGYEPETAASRRPVSRDSYTEQPEYDRYRTPQERPVDERPYTPSSQPKRRREKPDYPAQENFQNSRDSRDPRYEGRGYSRDFPPADRTRPQSGYNTPSARPASREYDRNISQPERGVGQGRPMPQERTAQSRGYNETPAQAAHERPRRSQYAKAQMNSGEPWSRSQDVQMDSPRRSPLDFDNPAPVVHRSRSDGGLSSPQNLPRTQRPQSSRDPIEQSRSVYGFGRDAGDDGYSQPSERHSPIDFENEERVIPEKPARKKSGLSKLLERPIATNDEFDEPYYPEENADMLSDADLFGHRHTADKGKAAARSGFHFKTEAVLDDQPKNEPEPQFSEQDSPYRGRAREMPETEQLAHGWSREMPDPNQPVRGRNREMPEREPVMGNMQNMPSRRRITPSIPVASRTDFGIDEEMDDTFPMIDDDITQVQPVIQNGQNRGGRNTGRLLEREKEAQSDFTDNEDQDFNDPSETPNVVAFVLSTKRSSALRMLFSALLAFVLVYFSLAVVYPLPLPHEAMFPEKNMSTFLMVNLVVYAAMMIVCSPTIGSGFVSLFRLEPDGDSPAALATVAVLIQGIALLLKPDKVYENAIPIYFGLAAVILMFSQIGQVMLSSRLYRNFRFLSGKQEKYSMLTVKNRDLARELSRGLNPDIQTIAYSAKANFLTSFFSGSYSPDFSQTINKIVVPASLLGAIVVGGVTYYFSKNIYIALTAFAAVTCVCSPLTASLVPNFSLSGASKRLCGRDAILTGYDAVEEYARTDVIVCGDTELFAEDAVILHGMKVFSENRVDEAILDAASVILSCGGVMEGVFLGMIGGRRDMLKKVDSLIYEDGLGISAWVDGKRVLIGNANLMRHHGISSPSKDFEARFIRDGREVFYLANSGELTAMFVVSYNPSIEIQHAINDLVRHGISLILHTTDSNLTAGKIASIFHIRKDGVKIIPAKMQEEYNGLTATRQRAPAGAAHNGSFVSAVKVVMNAIGVKKSVTAGAIIQLVGVLAGYGLVAFLAFTGTNTYLSLLYLLIYQAIWLLITSMTMAVKSVA